MDQELIRYALLGIEAEIVKLDTRIAELRKQQAQMRKAVGVRTSPRKLAEATAAQDGTATPAKAARKRRGGMSDEGRERIREAQKARWARVRAAQTVTAPTPDPELVDEPIKGGRAVSAVAKRTPKSGRRTIGNRKK